jgi:hypothetical protein
MRLEKKTKLHYPILVFLTGLIFSIGALADPQRYSERPDILKVEAGKHDIGKAWDKLKRGHLEGVAEIFGMYPDYEICFLARDAELLYDLARIKTEDENHPLHSKIHLLNISRANVNDSHLKDYLSQNGINEESLKGGKKFLFVDTGFAGTIPARINDLFPGRENQLQTHLIVSDNASHPSMRTFLSALNLEAADRDPGTLRGTIAVYEELPRSTDRSTWFEKDKETNRWEAMSNRGNFRGDDGIISPEKALQYMQDLKVYEATPEARALFDHRTREWVDLRSLSVLGNKKKLKKYLENYLKQNQSNEEKQFRNAVVRDFIEIVGRNKREYAAILPTPDEIGLPPLIQGTFGDKASLIRKHPEWKKVLDDPKKHIPKLLHEGDFLTVRSILDVSTDSSFADVAFEVFAGLMASEETPSRLKKQIKSTMISQINNGKNIGRLDIYFNKLPLEKRNDNDINKELIKTFQNDAVSLENVRKEVIEAFRWIKPADPEVLQFLIHTLQDPDREIRSATATTLEKVSPTDPQVHQALADAIKDPVIQVSLPALRILGDVKVADPAIHRAIADALKHSELRIRSTAATSLGKIKPTDPKIHQDLARALQDKEGFVRAMAAKALEEIKPTDAEALRIVVSCLKHEDRRVREPCSKLLTQPFIAHSIKGDISGCTKNLNTMPLQESEFTNILDSLGL